MFHPHILVGVINYLTWSHGPVLFRIWYPALQTSNAVNGFYLLNLDKNHLRISCFLFPAMIVDPIPSIMSARGLLFRYQCQFQHIQNGIAITKNTQSLQTYNVSCHPNSSRRRPTLMTTATHAFSLSGSGAGAEYSSAGELVDIGRKERKKRIAGIDQDELLDPKLLADPDSCFCEFQGVEIHHKLHDPELHSSDNSNAQDQSQTPTLKLGLPMILLHGFGASVFSWNKVMKRLANLTGSKVLAFDRPAFGLTSRLDTFGTKANDVKPLNPYSMAFSVLATLYFIDFLAAEKAILVGHSAGSFVAVDAYFEAPERVAALILVAPAILAPRAIPKPKVVETKGDGSDSNNLPKTRFEFFGRLFMFIKYVTQAIMQMITWMANMFNSLYKKALSSILRSALGVMLVRIIIDKFGVAAVRMAFYDSKQVNEHIIDGYTKPLRTKGWDKALVEFTAAMLLKGESETKLPLSKRLHEISCPVLIVTGDTDRIVPSWNAERLSRAIPHSKLEVIKNCGHLPHEEKVDEFVGIVEKFLQRAFGGLEEHFLHAVT
ncbi:Alpha/beta-Hydrolases superfamily protein isoform 2 [Hibiscus syriacus]|uniref:Alpha/beta-Hydrolases superfamily protein isoform 2 n=1 Tax=Hibiscus syriacus TaxID=106335 RepID=A0A6A2Z0F2_HIBSY|nr:2-hydroxy-6-oxononadienedioate/2-hydroxy-6-oxononatrienedioate hydrolase 2-like [Hibiscus syriacus]KAE8684970.1 Alpha/beta-Hydrolases superfamily protein isoform 2 [Hibiscus syriacus]